MCPNLEFKDPTENIHGARHVTRGIFLWFTYVNDQRVARMIDHGSIVLHGDRLHLLLGRLDFLGHNRGSVCADRSGDSVSANPETTSNETRIRPFIVLLF